MSSFSVWALSIAGIVMLGVLVDIIMPEGQTSKYIKSVFAIITVFVIAAPIPALLTESFSLDDIFGGSSYEIDQGFIESLNRQKVSALKATAADALVTAGYKDIDFMVTHETVDNALFITHIFVDLSSAKYNGTELNVNNTSGITDILRKIFSVKQEAISYYG